MSRPVSRSTFSHFARIFYFHLDMNGFQNTSAIEWLQEAHLMALQTYVHQRQGFCTGAQFFARILNLLVQVKGINHQGELTLFT